MEYSSEINSIPKISIITVSYNEGANLEETILNIISQDYPNIEFIIIDGGSTDSTKSIIKKYEKHISYWISEKDEGIYDAMNKGIQKVTGEWFNFMNIGDRFSNDTSIGTFVENLNANKAIVFSDTINFTKGGKEEYARQHGLFKKGFLLNQMPHQATFFNTKKTAAFQYDLNFNVAADLDLLTKVYLKYGASSFHHIAKGLVYYQLGGFSEAHYDDLVKDRYNIIKKLPIKIRWINLLNFHRQQMFRS